MLLKLDKNDAPEMSSAFLYANIIIIVAFSLIFSRLWYLQIIKGEDFKNLSENNRIRVQEIPAPRGILYDRDKTPLVDSFPSFDVSLYRQDVPSMEILIPRLSRVLLMDSEKLWTKIEAAKASPPFQPLKIKTDISRRELALLETRRLDLPGISADVVIRRNYPYGNLASHLIGYLGEINSDELQKLDYMNHKVGYLIGKYGIEQKFELELMGENGGRQVEVNALGRKIKVLGNLEPNPGNNLFLTLDLALQQTAEEAMTGYKGAVVVMDPRNGDILALASKPDFDPNLFARGITPENWKNITGNPSRPLQNRATQGQYPPGSIFKIITAIAGLEEKVITPESSFYCGGSLTHGNRDFLCWKKEGHGRIGLRQAIVESCDVYFYQLGLLLGVDRIAKHAFEFGFGKPTGYPLGNEKSGLIPTSSWKMRRVGIPWQTGETLSTAIGQGFNLVTPLQIASMLTAVANGGKIYQPRLVQAIQAPYGETLNEFHPQVLNDVNVSPKTMEFIREALWGVINLPNGTGGRARIPGFDVAGKTGTAQVVQRREGKNDPTSPDLQDHAWFACFAPAQQPQIVVAVLLENGGGGGANAAPVARKILEYYFTQKKETPNSSFQVAYQIYPSR
jgi:penicillin-binding protein 2